MGYWTGPRHPNATLYDPCDPGCPDGCLFDLGSDPAEQIDLRESSAHGPLWSTMVQRLAQLSHTVFDTNYTGRASECVNQSYYKALWRCHRGPACFEPGAVPPLPPGSVGADGEALCSLTPKSRGSLF